MQTRTSLRISNRPSSKTANNNLETQQTKNEEAIKGDFEDTRESIVKASNTLFVKSIRESALDLSNPQNQSFSASVKSVGEKSVQSPSAAANNVASAHAISNQDDDHDLATAVMPNDQDVGSGAVVVRENGFLHSSADHQPDSNLTLDLDLNDHASSSSSPLSSLLNTLIAERSDTATAAPIAPTSSSAFTLQNIIARPLSAASNVSSSAEINSNAMQHHPILPSFPSFLYQQPLSTIATSGASHSQVYNTLQPRPTLHLPFDSQQQSTHSFNLNHQSQQQQQHQQNLLQGMHQQIQQQIQQQQQQQDNIDRVGSAVPLLSTTNVEGMASDPGKTQRGKRATVGPDGVKRYFCKFQGCGRYFSTSGHLTRHFKIHTGEKTHQCPILHCASLFSRKDNMLQHFIAHRKKLESLNTEILFKPTTGDQQKTKYEAAATKSKGRKRAAGLADGDEGEERGEEKKQVLQWHGEKKAGKGSLAPPPLVASVPSSRAPMVGLVDQKQPFVQNGHVFSARQVLKPPFLDISHLQQQQHTPWQDQGRDHPHQEQRQHEYPSLHHQPQLGPLSAPPFVSTASPSSFLSNAFSNYDHLDVDRRHHHYPNHQRHQTFHHLHPQQMYNHSNNTYQQQQQQYPPSVFRHPHSSNSSPYMSPALALSSQMHQHAPHHTQQHESRHHRSQTTPLFSHDPFWFPEPEPTSASVLHGNGNGNGNGNDVGGFGGGGRGGEEIHRRPASTPALTGSLYSALMDSSSIASGGPSGFTFSTRTATGDATDANANGGDGGDGGKEHGDVGGVGVGISMTVFGSPQFTNLMDMENETCDL